MQDFVRDIILTSVEDNVKYIKELFNDNTDVVYRQFNIADWKAAIIYLDGMADKILLNNFVLESLMLENNKISRVDEIKDRLLTVSDCK